MIIQFQQLLVTLRPSFDSLSELELIILFLFSYALVFSFILLLFKTMIGMATKVYEESWRTLKK